MMTATQLADLAVHALEDGKADDIRVLDVRDQTAITDFMIVASGRSNRQVRSLAEKVLEAAKLHGVTPIGIEGESQAEWVLVDLGDVVVHTMQPATRDFYQLEKLWGEIAEHRKRAV
jgi:ribosome-associated protein